MMVCVEINVVRAVGKFRQRWKFGPKSTDYGISISYDRAPNKDGKNVCAEDMNSGRQDDVGPILLEVTVFSCS